MSVPPSRPRSVFVGRPPFRWRRLVRALYRRYPHGVRLPLALVSIAAQRLYVVRGLHLLRSYRVSTSRFGSGSRCNSRRTPLGAHCVRDKVGAGGRSLAVFKGRVATGKYAKLNPLATIGINDAVCTRILWLDGLEQHNRGGYSDSARRCIYIHGSADERRLGRPASIGCVRMSNADVMEVFDTLSVGSLVHIC